MPQIGVEIAVVSSVAVTTQVKAAWSPPRSWMMTGSDVETTVEASIETNMPSSRPDSASSTLRCDMRGLLERVDLLGFAEERKAWPWGSFGRSGWTAGDVDGAN